MLVIVEMRMNDKMLQSTREKKRRRKKREPNIHSMRQSQAKVQLEKKLPKKKNANPLRI